MLKPSECEFVVTRPQTSHVIFISLIFAFGVQRADGEGESTSAIGPDGEVNSSILCFFLFFFLCLIMHIFY